MTSIKLTRWIILAVLLVSVLSVGLMPPLTALPAAAAEPAGGPESISGSYVYFNTAISDDDCFVQGRTQTFCLQGISYTNDWDYVYYLWLRFPDGWAVSDVTVYDTPYSVNGGTFGTFSWSAPADNEVRIEQVRYQANPSDTCTAYYCVEVRSGSPPPGGSYANVSWYWVSSVFGSPPYYPCSSDGYTPAGQQPCDEMTTPPAYIGRCPPRIYLPGVFRNW